MSAFRERLLEGLKAKNVGLPSEAPGAVEAVFSDLKAEFHLDDQELMEQVCFYSRVRNMSFGDDKLTFGDDVSEDGSIKQTLVSQKNSTLLRRASVELLRIHPSYLTLLLHNAQRTELQRETAQAAGDNAKSKLATMSRIAAFLSNRPGVDSLKGGIVVVLHNYKKKSGKNFEHFNRLLGNLESRPSDSTARLLEFLEAVQFLYTKKADNFRKAFEIGFKLLPLQPVSASNRYLKVSEWRDSWPSNRPLALENGRLNPGFMRVAPNLPELTAGAGNGASGGGAGAAAVVTPPADLSSDPSAPPLPVGRGWPGPVAAVLPPPPATEKPFISDDSEDSVVIPGPPGSAAVPFADLATGEPSAPPMPPSEIARELKADYVRLVDAVQRQSSFVVNVDFFDKYMELNHALDQIIAQSALTDMSPQIAFHRAHIRPHIKGVLDVGDFDTVILKRIQQSLVSLQERYMDSVPSEIGHTT